MAKARTAKKGRRSKTTSRRRSRSASNGSNRDDAIGLLKSDHREVEQLFKQFEDSRGEDRKQEIAAQICEALKAHTMIEEEIFYPAFLEATDETDIHHEAEVEHQGAKHLIEEIESAGPSDDHFDARVTVLQEMIRHHVNEEEQRGGMFSKAQSSEMDLTELGRQMRERKLEIMGESAEMGGSRRPPQQGRSRRGGRELRARSS
ncbi:MAG TPA: hemerythrin domain-containing protein [Gammaproteobacteria bacterium]|nr:hemerythrin domain-containing protein [Gammaproteobacteria bacterium]